MSHGRSAAVHYIHGGVDLTEAVFVVVVMVLASSRPILRLAEALMTGVARLFGGSLAALWFTIMTLGPLLGSLITEPAAMTICAMLLSHTFYSLGPSLRFRYATLALLFVNVSVGGVLTHFAAPPVLMVAEPWGWGTAFMLSHFGWKVICGIAISNGLHFLLFRGELAQMQRAFAVRALTDEIERKYLTHQAVELAWDEAVGEGHEGDELRNSMEGLVGRFTDTIHERLRQSELKELAELGYDGKLIEEAIEERFSEVRLHRARKLLPLLLDERDRAEFVDPAWDQRDDPVPMWITLVHVALMIWAIVNAHHPPLLVLGLLFFLGFTQVSARYQNRVRLRPAMLVGFFLASLVIHGGLQAWWIEPVLGHLSEGALMLGATVLTAFNDNASITYLSTLVPGFTASLRYAVVAGAVAGGGLTVIANAPNPAGLSMLRQHFDGAVSPRRLLQAALVPTVILWLCLAFL
jgi:hypothetical protein